MSTIKLDKLALGGDALGRDEGRVVFVAYGAPGDAVELERAENKKAFLRAWPARVAEQGDGRVDPPCPYFYRPGRDPRESCGGCDWQHLSYDVQLDWKQRLLIETFQRLGGVAKPAVEKTRPSSPWRYRNKVQVPFEERDGRIVAGFYAPQTHRVVPFDDCLIQTEASVRIVHAALEFVNAKRLKPWDASTGAGVLRHLLVRTNADGKALVALVAAKERFPEAPLFAKHIHERCPKAASVFLNVNAKPGNAVLSPRWVQLWGKPFLDERLCGLRFRLSPGAFFQVNRASAETLYRMAAEMAAPDPSDDVLELYAGVGAISFLLSPRCKSAIAVEESRSAVADGIESARLNGIDNVRFMTGRCEDVMARKRVGAPSIVVVDPPRAGCDRLVLKQVMRLKPRRIVYVSCDPATLARDARYLSTGGYHLKRSVPVDLFPQTAHIESVSLFAP